MTIFIYLFCLGKSLLPCKYYTSVSDETQSSQYPWVIKNKVRRILYTDIHSCMLKYKLPSSNWIILNGMKNKILIGEKRFDAFSTIFFKIVQTLFNINTLSLRASTYSSLFFK